MNISVIGGGSWGTAIARLLKNKGNRIKFYIRDSEVRNDINSNNENSKYLPGIKLYGFDIHSDISKTIEDTEIIVMGVPSHAFRSVVLEIKPFIKNQIIVNLSKGIELGTLKRMSEISKEILVDNSFVCLSGPSHAEEVGLDIPTVVTVASDDIKVSKIIQDTFVTKKFRVYTSNDLIGVEIGGALKNIIALAAGLSDGLKYGDNTKAALCTRGMYEMTKLGTALGARPHTLSGLSGIGDLIVTCTSMHSRNRKAGILIGQGYSPKEAAIIVGQVVEGVKTTKSAYQLAKRYGIEMPITEKLYDVLYNGLDPHIAVDELMNREYKLEIDENFFIK